MRWTVSDLAHFVCRFAMPHRKLDSREVREIVKQDTAILQLLPDMVSLYCRTGRRCWVEGESRAHLCMHLTDRFEKKMVAAADALALLVFMDRNNVVKRSCMYVARAISLCQQFVYHGLQRERREQQELSQSPYEDLIPSEKSRQFCDYCVVLVLACLDTAAAPVADRLLASFHFRVSNIIDRIATYCATQSELQLDGDDVFPVEYRVSDDVRNTVFAFVGQSTFLLPAVHSSGQDLSPLCKMMLPELHRAMELFVSSEFSHERYIGTTSHMSDHTCDVGYFDVPEAFMVLHMYIRRNTAESLRKLRNMLESEKNCCTHIAIECVVGGESPLETAIDVDSVEMVTLLLEMGAECKQEHLLQARSAAVRELLERALSLT
ncbi:MAG: hypothetical protein MHM6MM_008946 [Cercozoa sp. M6MM]